jgi:hypothetical protein
VIFQVCNLIITPKQTEFLHKKISFSSVKIEFELKRRFSLSVKTLLFLQNAHRAGSAGFFSRENHQVALEGLIGSGKDV